MKKKPIMGVFALILVGLISISAFAMPWGGKGRGQFGNDAAKEALDSGDYDAFVDAVGESKRAGQMTEERFNSMVERHSLMSERMAEREAMREKVRAALDAEDYDAWKVAIAECERSAERFGTITSENFGTLVELHQAKERVRTLSEELGLERPMHKGFGRGGHEHRMMIGEE